MTDTVLVEQVRRKFTTLNAFMDERMRRQWAASEAMAVGWGGVTAVAVATGLSRNTVDAGIREVRARAKQRCRVVVSRRIRREGGGRKPIEQANPSISGELEGLVEPLTRGDPQSPLRWTCRSTRNLADELQRRGHVVGVGERTVAMLLHRAGYSLQSNRKVRDYQKSKVGP